MADDSTSAHSSSISKSRRIKKPSGRKMLALLVILVLAAAVGYFAYKYNEAQQDVERLSNPTESAKLASEQLVSEVGQLVVLPTGETPTIATVSDASKLKNQAFFAEAENGDKVLIYTQAKRAILYRPSTGKVIEIAPINLGNNQNNSENNSENNSGGD